MTASRADFLASISSSRRLVAFRSRVRQNGPPIAIILGLLLLWEFAVRVLDVPIYVVPSVSALLNAIYVEREILLSNSVPTLLAAGSGFVIGNAIAVILAVTFVFSRILEKSLMPVAVALRSVPGVAITPLLILWMGYGLSPRVTVVALTVFFPTLVNLVRGLRSAETEAFELMHSLSASRLQVLLKVRWPASLPYLFAALRIGAPMAILTAMLSEWIAADEGLGYLIILSSFQFRVELLWADIVVLTLLAVVAFLLIDVVERPFMWWRR